MLKKISNLFFCLLILCVSVSGKIAYADETNKDGSFSVSPLNVETGEVQNNYFDLVVTPSQQLDLKVRIYNSSSKELHIKVESNTGTTNDNGITSYLKTKEKDSSLKVAFEDISKVESDVVSVPANGTADAVVHVTMPETSFEGTILGGLRFTDTDGEKKAKESTAAVANNIAYVIAVVLRESDQEVQPRMQLNKVFTEQRNARNYISANLQNSAPRLIKNLEVSAKIYKKGTNELQYESSKSNLKMAPNSNFNYGTSLEDQAFVAGDYTMKLSGTADGTPFSFEKDFTIKKKDAADFNKNAVYIKNQPQDNTMLYVIIAILIAVLILGIIAVIFLRKEKRREK